MSRSPENLNTSGPPPSASFNDPNNFFTSYIPQDQSQGGQQEGQGQQHLSTSQPASFHNSPQSDSFSPTSSPPPPNQGGLLNTPFDINTANQNFADFNLFENNPNQGVNPSALYTDTSSPRDTLNPQDLMAQASLLPPQPVDWSGMAFTHPRQHQRALSEHSDISPHPSPYLSNREFPEQPSPLLMPGGEGHGEMSSFLHNDNLGLDQFTLNDPPQVNNLSPHQSPHISPHLTPQHTGNSPRNSLQGSPFLLNQFQFPGGPGPMGQPPQQVPTVPSMHEPRSREGSVFPPEIQVEFAPPQRQPTFPGKLQDESALSPPPRSKQARQRSKSDPPMLTISRPSSPLHGHSHSISFSSGTKRDSLHPQDAASPGGHSSPSSPGPSGVSKHNRRSSTSSIPNRDYILDLAAPQRPGSTATDTKRVQKHPATFQCHLCPKRFTRAYNLRSHLRTHTDERPFVCTVCGKAFARQHDRKRHEGLHSGEKKFVCRGELKQGGTWGCGRRFARADALGRHFRSEAGRICIKPLLDEESSERMRAQQENMAVQMDPNQYAPVDPHLGFPLALLSQYPALANWDGMSGPEDEDDRKGSFDASSGGEWDEGSSGMGSHRSSFDESAFQAEMGERNWATGEPMWQSQDQ